MRGEAVDEGHCIKLVKRSSGSKLWQPSAPLFSESVSPNTRPQSARRKLESFRSTMSLCHLSEDHVIPGNNSKPIELGSGAVGVKHTSL
jgi:hypothetical protein